MRALRALLALSFIAAPVAPAAIAIEPDIPARLIEAREVPAIEFSRRLVARKWASTKKLTRQGLKDFYAARNNTPLFTTKIGLSERARNIIAEIKNADNWGLRASDYDLPDADFSSTDAEELFKTEIQLALQVLKYARDARGGRYDPKRLSLSIDRTPPLLPAETVLKTVAGADDVPKALQSFHPQHEQFKRLRKLYLSLRNSRPEAESEQPISESAAEETGKKNRSKKKAKKKSESPKKLAARVLYNMEMWRWMPETLGGYYIQSNIPEFKFRIVKDASLIHEERIIVGKVKNQTPIFSDELERVVFHPFWGVPNSIKVKELLPGLLRGKDTLAKNGLRMKYNGRDVDPWQVDWNSTDIRNFHVYQPPSTKNALGIVKFLFPNKHQVYMHDTPTKHLFKKSTRTFSHGCMRVKNPVRFAEIIFQNDRAWGAKKIASIIRAGQEDNNIKLNNKVPVHVTYFTVHVDKSGKATYFKDIYGHEKLIKLGLAGKAHTIVLKKPNLDKLVGASKKKYNPSSFGSGFFSSAPSSRDRNWVRNAFNYD